MLKLPYEEIHVDVIHNPSKNEFHNLVKSAEGPFKVKGSIDHWVLFKILSQLKDPIDQCDYIASLAPNEKIHYTVLPPEQNGALGLNEKLEQNFSFKSKQSLFPEFINQVKSYLDRPNKGTIYLQSTVIKILNKTLGCLDLFEGFSPLSQPRFWIGAGNQFIGLHNDPFRNIIALFSGRKRVIMFPPEELPNIYPAPFDKRAAKVITSLVNAYNPDLKKFPLFKEALKKVKIAVINPGEFLYMPPLWWHAVEGEGFNVGLNCWFCDDDKTNKLESLYLPVESLMLNINHDLTSDLERKYLYETFMQTIGSNIEISKSSHKLEFRTKKEAKKIKLVLSPLSSGQKENWERWISAFVSKYVFCLQGGNPFPTLDNSEYANMIKRLRKRKILRGIQSIQYRLFIFFKNLIKKKQKHGIVPT